MTLLSFFGFMILKIFYHATKVVEEFGSVVMLVLGLQLLMAIFINIGTNTGLTPATGIPLPLFSAGGSVTLATFLILGVIQSIISRSNLIYSATIENE
jgi:cell division protein FtsW (lipid II flippase)